MKKLKILAVQYKIHYLNLEANLKKFERLIREHMDLKPDLVVFPEYALTAPLYGHYNKAFDQNSEIFVKLSALAKKYEIYLIPGSFVRRIDNSLYNSTCLITDKGEILDFLDESDLYNKQILWSNEKRFLKKGSQSKVYKTRIGNIAVQICADLWSPKISEEYKKHKPDLIINLAMWSQEDIKACIRYVPSSIETKQTEYLAKARALESKSFFLFCNYGGRLNIKAKTGRVYKEMSIGNTMIIDPYGEIIIKTSTNKEEVLFKEIDLRRCHWAKY